MPSPSDSTPDPTGSASTPIHPFLFVLAGALILMGGLALLNQPGDDAKPSAASPGEPAGTSIVEAIEAGTTGTDAAASPLRTPLTMPPKAQFASVGLRAEMAIDLPDLTGIVWNQTEDAYYAIGQEGTVYRIDRDLANADVVLDLTAEVTELLPGSERGMLGIAFDPRDGRMFLYFTDRGDDTNVVSMVMSGGRPDPSTRRLVLFVEQPGLGHKAGDLQFDRAGNLFLAIGDGGGSRGRDAQDGSKLLGKILRILPKLDGEGYDVPTDNPFVGSSDIRPEIWATGLRNPWQFRLDEPTGVMYIGDVGENDVEELDMIPAGTSGQNFGWYWFEGSTDRGTVERPPEGVELTGPIYEYPHSVGPAVIGGQIYYGSAIPELRGAYFFGDMTGSTFAMGIDGTEQLDLRIFGVVTTFAETPDGELLATTLQSGIMRILPA